MLGWPGDSGGEGGDWLLRCLWTWITEGKPWGVDRVGGRSGSAACQTDPCPSCGRWVCWASTGRGDCTIMLVQNIALPGLHARFVPDVESISIKADRTAIEIDYSLHSAYNFVKVKQCKF
jgi:hypothetical protein